MTEIIEPHPLLIQYLKTANSLWTSFDNLKGPDNDSTGPQEWHYVMSNLEQNIFLLHRLNQRGLLPQKTKICDAGIGLGSALFDLYLQSLSLEGLDFEFWGIEKQAKYLEFLGLNLLPYWNNKLHLIESDLEQQDFWAYDLVYTYSPYVKRADLRRFYQKIQQQIKTGALIIENREFGLGLEGVLEEVSGLEKIQLDDIWVFRKV